MKHFLFFFAITFTIFFYIGCEKGKEAVTNEEHCKATAFKNIAIIPTDSGVLLGIQNKNEHLYLYNVDSNKLEQFDPLALKSVESIKVNDPAILAFMKENATKIVGGGIATGVTIAGVLQNAKPAFQYIKTPNGKGTVIGVVLGTVFGMTAGEMYGKWKYEPDLTSDSIRRILVEPSNWLNAKQHIFNNLTTEIREDIDKINDHSIREAFIKRLNSFTVRELGPMLRTRMTNATSVTFNNLFAIQSEVKSTLQKEL
jgi:hypothetical protein